MTDQDIPPNDIIPPPIRPILILSNKAAVSTTTSPPTNIQHIPSTSILFNPAPTNQEKKHRLPTIAFLSRFFRSSATHSPAMSAAKTKAQGIIDENAVGMSSSPLSPFPSLYTPPPLFPPPPLLHPTHHPTHSIPPLALFPKQQVLTKTTQPSSPNPIAPTAAPPKRSSRSSAPNSMSLRWIKLVRTPPSPLLPSPFPPHHPPSLSPKPPQPFPLSSPSPSPHPTTKQTAN